MEKVLISACLCGENCKYDGKNNLNKRVNELNELCDLVLVCPETFGGLKTPRDPSEIKGNQVISKKGRDVTGNFNYGAGLSAYIASEQGVRYALLKEGSPSCGVHKIYDGTFTNRKIAGEGITTRELIKQGIKVFSEDEIDDLIALLKTE